MTDQYSRNSGRDMSNIAICLTDWFQVAGETLLLAFDVLRFKKEFIKQVSCTVSEQNVALSLQNTTIVTDGGIKRHLIPVKVTVVHQPLAFYADLGKVSSMRHSPWKKAQQHYYWQQKNRSVIMLYIFLLEIFETHPGKDCAYRSSPTMMMGCSRTLLNAMWVSFVFFFGVTSCSQMETYLLTFRSKTWTYAQKGVQHDKYITRIRFQLSFCDTICVIPWYLGYCFLLLNSLAYFAICCDCCKDCGRVWCPSNIPYWAVQVVREYWITA